jgi:hypothetical protein
MTNTYKAISTVGEHYFGAGVTDHDLTAVEEKDALQGGHLELVPRTYRVLSDNYTAAAQGETFEGSFLVENEAALIQGGHIERVDPAPKPAPKPPKKED